MPSKSNAKIVFGPRAVPAASSCSEATATTGAHGRLQRARGRAQHDRLAAHHLDDVVVAVLVGDQQQIGLEALDRRVVPLQAAALGERRHVAERIDRHRRLPRRQAEGRLPIPLNLHAAPLESGCRFARACALRRRDGPPSRRRALSARSARLATPTLRRRPDRRRSRTGTPRAGRSGTALRSDVGRTSGPVSTAWLVRAAARQGRGRRAGAGSGCSRGTRRRGSRRAAAAAARCAAAAPTPWACSPDASVEGSVAARPAIISVKKIPIEIT